MINVGIFLFNEVEVLDFARPFEVLSITEKDNQKLFPPNEIPKKFNFLASPAFAAVERIAISMVKLSFTTKTMDMKKLQ